VVVDRLSDRVTHWFTLNEPACFIGHGHRIGIHAPGLQLPDGQVMRAWHHALLAHGRAVRVIRTRSKQANPMIGSAPCFNTYYPQTNRPEDIEAARRLMFERAGATCSTPR
jgi:beta-glucosidase